MVGEPGCTGFALVAHVWRFLKAIDGIMESRVRTKGFLDEAECWEFGPDIFFVCNCVGAGG